MGCSSSKLYQQHISCSVVYNIHYTNSIPRASKNPIGDTNNNRGAPPPPLPHSVVNEARGLVGNLGEDETGVSDSTPLKRRPKSQVLGAKKFTFKLLHLPKKQRKPLMGKENKNPLFDPDLIEYYEREHEAEGRKIKMTTTKESEIPSKKEGADSMLEKFESKCPPAGENRVVIYTTTLRGILKTFEDCNAVRSVVKSNQVDFCERDISMDAGYREELRALMGGKDVKLPLLFVKGRLVGTAHQVLKLEEEGSLKTLFDGMPRAIDAKCEGCDGVNFVICADCHGSSKVFEKKKKKKKKKVKCGSCNENGLIRCSICYY